MAQAKQVKQGLDSAYRIYPYQPFGSCDHLFPRGPGIQMKTGWTPAELADFVGVTRATSTAIEDGSYDPSLFLAYDIAEALDVSVTEFFPPVPRRVRLEYLAARPWYVRLFFE